jgi:soluble lytic murein transglycosylase-like protein
VLPAPPPSTDPYHWVRAGELRGMGFRSQARRELRAFERAHAGQDQAVGALLSAYPAVDGYRDAIRLANARGGSDPTVVYPLAFWPLVSGKSAAHRVDPLLVLALMRQESLFDPAARSPADARGLMQLLPSTAERVARERAISAPTDHLFDPDVNVTLGVAYLDQLMRAHHQDPLKALAAYNGGETALARWEERFGGLEPDEFVESITYRETRDYVKKVMGNFRRYQQLYARGLRTED